MPPNTRSRAASTATPLLAGLEAAREHRQTGGTLGQSYGLFARLPLEIRLKIWTLLLLLPLNTISQEPQLIRVSDDGESDFIPCPEDDKPGSDVLSEDDEIKVIVPTCEYDLGWTILLASRAIYQETSDVFYRENLFFRLHIQSFEKNDVFDLAEHLLAIGNLHGIMGPPETVEASKMHAMDIAVMRSSNIMSSLSELGRIEFLTVMFPITSMDSLLACLHSMMVFGWKSDHFGDYHKLVLRVKNKYMMSEQTVYDTYLVPFRGLYGFRNARIIGMKRTDAVKKLENMFWRGSYMSMYTEQDMHRWRAQTLKLFYSTHRLYARVYNVEARRAWLAVLDNLNMGCAWWQHVNELSGSELFLLHRTLFWCHIMVARCSRHITLRLGEPESRLALEKYSVDEENYEELLDCCRDNLPLFNMEEESISEGKWWSGKHKLELYFDYANFCIDNGNFDEAVAYLGRCIRSTFAEEKYQEAYNYAQRECLKIHGTEAEPPEEVVEELGDQIDFADFNTTDDDPEKWVHGNVKGWTTVYQTPPTTDDEDDDDDDDKHDEDDEDDEDREYRRFLATL